MKRYLPLLLAFACVLPGCGLLGITQDEAVATTEKLMRGIEGVQQMLDNAAKMDGVRKEVAKVSVSAAVEMDTALAALAEVAAFFTMEKPTVDDYKVALGKLQEASDSGAKAALYVRSIDNLFGETELPPDLQLELIKLRDSSARLIERIRTTAARVKKASDVLVKLGTAAGAALPGGSGAAAIIASIVAGVASLGATADAVAKKTNGGSAS